MEKVMKNFTLLRWIEIALLIVGLALVYRFTGNRNFYWGIGLGLAMQAALMLGADYFAERRGGIYLTGLRSLAPQAP
jgi:hypothetical protein